MQKTPLCDYAVPCSVFLFCFLQHMQHERKNDKRGAHPFGRTRELGVDGLGLVLGQERVCHAADGAGETGGLTGLEQHDADHEQTAQNLQNHHKRIHESYLRKIVQRDNALHSQIDMLSQLFADCKHFLCAAIQNLVGITMMCYRGQ